MNDPKIILQPTEEGFTVKVRTRTHHVLDPEHPLGPMPASGILGWTYCGRAHKGRLALLSIPEFLEALWNRPHEYVQACVECERALPTELRNTLIPEKE